MLWLKGLGLDRNSLSSRYTNSATSPIKTSIVELISLSPIRPPVSEPALLIIAIKREAILGILLPYLARPGKRWQSWSVAGSLESLLDIVVVISFLRELSQIEDDIDTEIEGFIEESPQFNNYVNSFASSCIVIRRYVTY